MEYRKEVHMGQIKVTGNKRLKKKIERSAGSVAIDLGIKSDVNIRFMDYDSPDKYGFAALIMGSHYVCIFNDCPDDKLGEVISHEMIHVKQTERGDLVFDYDNQIFYWQGDKYTVDRLKDMSYYDRPWEAEAKKLEKNLAKHFSMS